MFHFKVRSEQGPRTVTGAAAEHKPRLPPKSPPPIARSMTAPMTTSALSHQGLYKRNQNQSTDSQGSNSTPVIKRTGSTGPSLSAGGGNWYGTVQRTQSHDRAPGIHETNSRSFDHRDDVAGQGQGGIVKTMSYDSVGSAATANSKASNAKPAAVPAALAGTPCKLSGMVPLKAAEEMQKKLAEWKLEKLQDPNTSEKEKLKIQRELDAAATADALHTARAEAARQKKASQAKQDTDDVPTSDHYWNCTHPKPPPPSEEKKKIRAPSPRGGHLGYHYNHTHGSGCNHDHGHHDHGHHDHGHHDHGHHDQGHHDQGHHDHGHHDHGHDGGTCSHDHHQEQQYEQPEPVVDVTPAAAEEHHCCGDSHDHEHHVAEAIAEEEPLLLKGDGKDHELC